jgi:peptidoglycan/LPS O-acetylase OafA/YrhL
MARAGTLLPCIPPLTRTIRNIQPKNRMSRLPGLDLLRAIAIVWVMLFHSFVVGGLGDDFSWLSRFGWMGVDLFFVLSGFLIGSQILKPLARGEPLDFGDFYLRRAFRILPAFLVVLALYVALPAFREEPGMQPWWQFATFTVNFLIDYEHNKAFSHAWSLCVEEHFYLLFPLLAWWLTRRPSAKKFVGVCAVIALGGIAIRTSVWLFDMAPVQGVENAGRSLNQRFIEDMYYPTWNRLDGLLAGVVLATLKAFRREAWDRLQASANVALIAGLAVVVLAIWSFRDRTAFVGNSIGWPILSAGLALLVFAGAGTRSWIGRWRVPGASWLALISYSLYLVHKPVYHMVANAFGAQLEGRGLIAFAVYASAALLAGALLHHAVERPFLRLRDRFTGRQPQQIAIAVS